MLELLPCPFCGGTDIQSYRPRPGGQQVTCTRFELYCVGCGAVGPTVQSQYSTIRAWNTRKDGLNKEIGS